MGSLFKISGITPIFNKIHEKVREYACLVKNDGFMVNLFEFDSMAKGNYVCSSQKNQSVDKVSRSSQSIKSVEDHVINRYISG